jgi:PhnB protein
MTSHAPEGYSSVCVVLVVEGVEKQIEFLENVFDAEVKKQIREGDGTIRYAEARIGDSIIMLERAGVEQPASRSTSQVWVKDVEAVYQRAVQEGAESVDKPPALSLGRPQAVIRDPQGNTWRIAQASKKLSSRQVEKLLTDQRRSRL